MFTQACGVSYSKVNATTLANMTTMSAKAKEELWVKRVMMGADQDNVFYDEMIGAPGSGKPFIRQDDLGKVDGDTINIPTMAPLGGPGVQGEGDRSGAEEKIRIGSYPCQIGRFWYGVGITDVAKEQTVIGGQFDNLVNGLLRKRLGKKKAEDGMMVLKANAASYNVVRPNFKTTREALRSADTVGTTTITRAGLALSALGGKPVKMRTTKVGSVVEQFLFFGSQWGLSALSAESAYLEAQKHAAERGAANPIFAGDYSSWDGHGIYRWYIRDHDAYGAVGSVILPRAFLGTAITSATTAQDITGGGDATGPTILPAPLYFEMFSNALYTFTNAVTVAADTATDRYVAIQNLTGANAGKIGFYNYRVNDGNKLTMRTRLGAAVTGIQNTTVGNVVYDVAPWLAAGSGAFAGLTDAHPSGSLIVECNSYGVPICGSFMLAEGAAVCGHGSLKGRNAMAARTEEERNHGMDHGIGVETSYGTAVCSRTDGKLPGYIYIESACPIDGFPAVT